MNQIMREISSQLYSFRRSISKMLAAEDAYLEYASSIGSTKAVKPKEVIAGRSDGEVTGISYEQQEQHLQYLQRRMIQTEENVADVERLLVGMDPDDVDFLEDMFWYRIPANIMAQERFVELRTVYYQRDKILKEMAKKAKKQ